MKHQILQAVRTCEAYQLYVPSQRQEPIYSIFAFSLMEQVAMDLFDHEGHKYLVMADRFSGLPWVKILRSLTTDAIISICRKWFLEFGFPKCIRTDNRPQFRTEFSAWCLSSGIIHETSSPYHPQSNGLAEGAVKAVKLLLKKCKTQEQFEKSFFYLSVHLVMMEFRQVLHFLGGNLMLYHEFLLMILLRRSSQLKLSVAPRLQTRMLCVCLI